VLFLIGLLTGLVSSAIMSPWWVRAIGCAVLWSPIAVLILLRYLEEIDPYTIATIALLTPRALKYPLLGILVGYALVTLLTVGQARRSGQAP